MCDELGEVGRLVCNAAMASLFDVCFKANDALNMGDKMGALVYVADSDLMSCAQTRSRGQSRLK